MMIAICIAFRRPSGSMWTIDFLHAGFLVISYGVSQTVN